ncbi:MAG: acetamidase/formamidase family protein [Actinomycetota bacterium]
MKTIQTIHSSKSHLGWDNSLSPAIVVEPATTLEIDLNDSSGGQLSRDSDPADLASLDFSRVNPLTGPISIDGAEPGDAIQITMLGFERKVDWGWTAIIPGFGLLADAFGDPAICISKYNSSGSIDFMGIAEIPFRPFAGTIGVALAESGTHSVVPPRNVGGNLDVRDLVEGSVLRLPVAVPGALLSIGDGHAAQGDGEVCGTAIETTLGISVTLGLIKGANLSAPRFETGPLNRQMDRDGYFVATGVGPDLLQCAKDAVSSMIDEIAARTSISPQDAYMLCSVAGDLRISEIVDAPNWVVSCYMPKGIFE